MTKTASAVTHNMTSNEHTLHISRLLDAPRELVYRMWTEKHLLDRWSCPDAFTISNSGAELKVGGTWHATMRAVDGGDMRLGGVYREIVPNQRLVFTHAWLDGAGTPGPITVVTVSFADENGKTRMELRQTGFDSAASRDGHEGGWTECLNKFSPLLDALKDNDREINIVRVIEAPVEKVFAAFSDPKGMAKWWGPNGFTTTTHMMDFRVGGTWTYTMHGPDGTDYPNHVAYTAIESDRSIAYDHGTVADQPPMFTAVINFEPQGSKTRVKLRLILGDAAERPNYVSFGAVEGGYQNLERLDAFLSAQH